MASNENVLTATVRTKVGKGSARRLRQVGNIPAVLYGRGSESIHLELPGHETFLIVKDSANAVVTVKFDGKSQLALVKSVQVHPVRRNILHVDLMMVAADQKVDVEVPLAIVGTSASGTVAAQEEFQLLVKAPATSIPEVIEVDVTGLEGGTMVRVADIAMPVGVVCEENPERVVAAIVVPSANVAEPAAAAEAEAGEAAEESAE